MASTMTIRMNCRLSFSSLIPANYLGPLGPLGLQGL